MTEAYEDDFLVRVRAQVMARDDHTGGWVPLAGGGLANVSVRKTTKSPPPLTPTNGAVHPQHEYRIYGKRISDQSVVLSCTIKKDFEYNKVMPTFHHWRTGQQRFGLTFQTAADARAFDKGVRIAVEELLYGLAGSCALTTLQKYNKQVGDDDVFMTLNLPLEPTQSRSSSEGSGSQDLNKKIHIISMKDKPDPLQLNTEQNENYSYVQLTAMHEYTYPVVEQNLGGGRDSSYSLKKRLAPDIPPSPPVKSNRKLTKSMRQRCRHCQELYFEEMNQRGDCEYAPDWFKSGIETITGIRCARCMLYHCMSDSEGEFSTHPCDCSNRDDGCGKKWIGLALLSLLVPCLLCYPPLKACHWLGMGCGLCGGRHGPTS